MKTHWGIVVGENIEIFDGSDAKDKVVIYRVSVDRLVDGEIKIVRSSGNPKIINNSSRLKTIDIAIKGSLFIEFVGARGFATGSCEIVGAFN